MGEHNLVINDLHLQYSGILKVDDLFRVINRALEERGYLKNEKRQEETVTEKGRNVYLELRPNKFKKEYMTLSFRIKIRLNNMKNTRQELDGKSFELDQGDVSCVFDAWLSTNYYAKWNKKPGYYFFKALVNKVFYRFPEEPGYKSELEGDAQYLYNEVMKLFASYRRRDKIFPDEVEIRASVAEDVEKVTPVVLKGGA